MNQLLLLYQHLLKENIDSEVINGSSQKESISESFDTEKIDLSKQAINVAKINAKMQQFGNRIKFINTDIDNFFSCKYDLIVSNPPYIKKCKLSSLIEDVKNFEPKLALDGGPDGFSVILKVITKSSKLLKKNGMLILEIDNTQVIKTKEMLKNYKFYTKDVFKDLSDKNRCITAIKL